jgi:hypothetical protein
MRGLPNRQHVIEVSTNLSVWGTLRTLGTGADGLLESVEPNSNASGGRFFRVNTP